MSLRPLHWFVLGILMGGTALFAYNLYLLSDKTRFRLNGEAIASPSDVPPPVRRRHR